MEHESARPEPLSSNTHERIERDLRAVVYLPVKSVLVEDWKRVIGFTIVIALIAAGWSYTLTPMYKATVVLQVKGKGSKGGASPLTDLALAAGVPLIADESADAAIGKLKSTTFARNFIEKEKLTDSLLSMPSSWMPDFLSFSALKPVNPSDGISSEYRRLERAREIFAKNIEFTVDHKTQLHTVQLLWDDPVKAAELANKMVRQVNNYMRQQAIDESKRSIAYLNSELSKTSLVPVQQAIYRLMEEQVKTQMTAGVSDDFALRFIDPASPPISRDRPRRKRIVIIAAVLGFVFTTIVLARRKFVASTK